MTYLVQVTNARDEEYANLSTATMRYIKWLLEGRTVMLSDQEQLDGSRDTIATYISPMDEVRREPVREVPTGASSTLYWYAIGQIDAMDGMSRANDRDAEEFSLYTEWSNVDMLAELWRGYYDGLPE